MNRVSLQVLAVCALAAAVAVPAADGAKAYVKWLVRAIFVANPGGKPKLLDYGHWELVGGTGTFAGMKGVGTLQIKPAGKTERRFILQGDLVPAP